MLTANEINHFTWAGLHFQKPFSIFRTARLNYNHWLRWDYSGRFTYLAFNVNSHATFKNNWQAGTGLTWAAFGISNNALRGTTAIRRLPGLGHNLYLTSDSRKKVYANLSLFNYWGFQNLMKTNDIELDVSFQPLDALRIVFSAEYSYDWRKQDQFVSNVAYNDLTRSIVGEVKQKTLRFTGRLSYNITPELTIQYYGQPYITRPLYSNFAYVSSPLAKKMSDRFYVYSPNQISFSNNEYFVDENMDGTADYSFYRPDFNFVQFRSNFVVRWEYRAGSELYFVWSQGNTPNVVNDLDTPITESLFDNAFSEGARNIFLIKCTYRFLR